MLGSSRMDWVRTLQLFTNRNAGRQTRLEVAGDEIGAQWAEQGFPLRGISYDPRDGRVEIMVGEQASLDRRMTHTIQDVVSVDVLQDEHGRDQALRVLGTGMQSLLRLVG